MSRRPALPELLPLLLLSLADAEPEELPDALPPDALPEELPEAPLSQMKKEFLSVTPTSNATPTKMRSRNVSIQSGASLYSSSILTCRRIGTWYRGVWWPECSPRSSDDSITMRVACRTRWRRPLVRRDLCLFPGDPGDPSEVEDSRPSSLAEKETLFADSGSSNSLSGVGELTAGGAAGSDVEIARVFAERPRDARRGLADALRRAPCIFEPELQSLLRRATPAGSRALRCAEPG